MTKDELIVWAHRNGLAVVDNAEYAELCAAAAAGITGQAQADREFDALFGRKT